MPTVKEIGEVKKISLVQQIEWSIPDYFVVAEDGEDLCLASSTFPVTGVLWHLRLWPSYEHLVVACEAYGARPGGYLASDAHREYSLEYTFGLKKCNGTIKHLNKGIIEKNQSRNIDKYDFIKKTQLLQRKSELVPSGVLTIVCTMQWMTEVSQSSTQPETVLDNKTKALKLISKLLLN